MEVGQEGGLGRRGKRGPTGEWEGGRGVAEASVDLPRSTARTIASSIGEYSSASERTAALKSKWHGSGDGAAKAVPRR